MRHLYVAVSPSRRSKPAVESVWDWEQLSRGWASACLTLTEATLPTDTISTEQAAQLSGFVLEQMKSAKHAMRNQCDLDLAAGVLDLCLHLLQFGFTQDQRVIELIFEHAVGIISVPQVNPNPNPTPTPTPTPTPNPNPNHQVCA